MSIFHNQFASLTGIFGAMEYALTAEELARARGLLQRLDPRVKVIGLLSLIVTAALARNLTVIAGIFAIAIALALLSRVPLRVLALRGWIGAFLFTGAIALPAVFLTPGRIVYRLPALNWPVTAQGLRSAMLLLGRAETAVTLSLLLVLCTPWMQVLKSLRVLRVPAVLVVILGMTYRYIFLFLQSAREMFEARQSRMVGTLDGRAARRLATAGVGVLLGKTLQLSNEVHLAMQSRGFRGEVETLDEFRMQSRDWIAIVLLLGLAGLALWFDRVG